MSGDNVNNWRRVARASAALSVLTLAACASPMSDSRRFSEPPEQLPPVQNSSVQTSNLPPLNSQQQAGGTYQQNSTYSQSGTYTQNGVTYDANGNPVTVTGQNGMQTGVLTTPNGQVVNAGGQTYGNQTYGSGGQTYGFPDDGLGQSRDPLLANSNSGPMTSGQVQANNGMQTDSSFTTINGAGDTQSIGQTDTTIAADATGSPTQVASRDLSRGLTPNLMTGSWTVVSGNAQCRINLSQTSSPGSDRNRASAPNCSIPVLNEVASWQLTGTQVQFFSDSGELIGALLKSGNRLIGTLSGGRNISMS